MKTFNPISNLILLLSIYLLFNSCTVTGPEETDLEIDLPTEIDSNLPNTSVSLDSIVGLDVNKLTAVFLKGQSKVNDDGTFYIEEVNAINENLPILFLKDNEIMFGYYPKANNGNSINLDDLLLFYVSINPEIAIQGLDNSELSKMIIPNKNYDNLKKQIQSSLNQNQLPLRNSDFLNAIITISTEIESNLNFSRKSTSKTNEEFSFNYSNSGTITWNHEIPIYSTMGIEIADESGNVIFGPDLLQSRSLIHSKTSSITYLYNQFYDELPESKGTFQLNKNGAYKITFSNGKDPNNSTLNDAVKQINRQNMAIDLVATAFPVGLKQVISSDCKTIINEFLTQFQTDSYQNTMLSQYYIEDWMSIVHTEIFNTLKTCMEPEDWHYYNYVNQATKYYHSIKVPNEISYTARDFYYSNILASQTLNYYDGAIYGNYTAIEYGKQIHIDVAYSSFQHVSKFKEEVIKWNFNSSKNNTNIQQVASYKPKSGIPFKVIKEFGDATPENNTIYKTNIEGELIITFKNGIQHIKGEQIDSRYEIEPISNSGLPKVAITMIIDSTNYYLNRIPGNWLYLNYEEDMTFQSKYEATLFAGGEGRVYKFQDYTGNEQTVEMYSPWQLQGNTDSGYFLYIIFLHHYGGRLNSDLTINDYGGFISGLGKTHVVKL